MMAATRGALIVLEGCDRVGKSTQAKLLVEYLTKRGKPAKLMNFPDRSTTIGKLLDEYLKQGQEFDDHAVHLLFSANRWEAASSMEKLLKSGTTLVLDRYSDSGIAFSSAKGLDFDWCRNSDAGLPLPDLVLFLQLSQEESRARGGYGQERYEKEQFQATVRDKFSRLQQDNWTVVSAEQKSIEELQCELRKLVDAAVKSALNKSLGHLPTYHNNTRLN
uniref:Thymidylate kinase n=1 Tax=Hirondellea gigas TaxID=1518452 RepID=A0A2P2I1I2_9CRUS